MKVFKNMSMFLLGSQIPCLGYMIVNQALSALFFNACSQCLFLNPLQESPTLAHQGKIHVFIRNCCAEISYKSHLTCSPQ